MLRVTSPASFGYYYAYLIFDQYLYLYMYNLYVQCTCHVHVRCTDTEERLHVSCMSINVRSKLLSLVLSVLSFQLVLSFSFYKLSGEQLAEIASETENPEIIFEQAPCSRA